MNNLLHKKKKKKKVGNIVKSLLPSLLPLLHPLSRPPLYGRVDGGVVRTGSEGCYTVSP